MNASPSRRLSRVTPPQPAAPSAALAAAPSRSPRASRARRGVTRLAIVTGLVALALLAGSSSALADWDAGSVSADPTEASPGDVVTFTATIAWTPDGGISSSASASFDATIPAQFTGVSWSCSGTNFTCDTAAGSGNSISVGGLVDDISAAASATLVVTATVADDAAEGPVATQICIAGSSVGDLFVNGARALPNLQDGCSSTTVTITAAPTPTPEPTLAPTEEPAETATAEPTPATPIAEPTETTAPPVPTPAPAPVTQLPSTGSGDSSSGLRAITMNGLTALLALAAFAVAGLRLRHKRG
jgi:hypothetical protein